MENVTGKNLLTLASCRNPLSIGLSPRTLCGPASSLETPHKEIFYMPTDDLHKKVADPVGHGLNENVEKHISDNDASA